MEVSLGLFLRAPFLVPAALAGGVLGVLAFRYLALQHQRHVEVVIDEQGIRELDDGALRLAIRWEDARLFAESRRDFVRAYRAPGRTDDDGAFGDRMRARTRTRLVVYVALFAAVCAFPWVGR